MRFLSFNTTCGAYSASYYLTFRWRILRSNAKAKSEAANSRGSIRVGYPERTLLRDVRLSCPACDIWDVMNWGGDDRVRERGARGVTHSFRTVYSSYVPRCCWWCQPTKVNIVKSCRRTSSDCSLRGAERWMKQVSDPWRYFVVAFPSNIICELLWISSLAWTLLAVLVLVEK